MAVQVILREPVDNLGERGDTVRVANGYARNYLLPRKLALPVTETNRRQVARERVVADARDAEEKQVAQVFADRLNRAVCVIARRVGDTDTLYGSVTSSDIEESLSAQSITVDRRKIQLAEPLKKLGAHRVPIKVHREVTATVTVRIVKEGAEHEPAAESGGEADEPTPDSDDAATPESAD
jgi:large subunit ribosomal protein L9